MARIPESEIERLKREISVERLAESRGVKLKRHGADLIGLCPFHNVFGVLALESEPVDPRL